MMGNIKTHFAHVPLSEKALIAIMAVTVLFFFAQSALPPDVSSAESDGVSGFLELIISKDTPIGLFVHENIRKIGHFAEYGAFGLEAAFYIFFFTEKRARSLFLASSSALFIAFIDETVQIFSGRGPSISDVWLDFSGFFTVALMTLGIIALFRKIKKEKI